MGQMGKKSRPWTGAELKIIKRIKDAGRSTTVKECQHLLPGRTLCAIKQAIARLPGGNKKRGRASWVWPMMEKLLKETPGLTNAELAKAIGCTRNGVLDATKHVLGKKVYVCGWSGNAPKYALGALPNVAKPAPCTRDTSYAVQKTVRDAKRNPFAVAMNQVIVQEAA